MEKKHLRREPRVDHRMPITLHFGDGAQVYQAQNVAYRGLFLETTEPLPLNRLVKLTADLEETTVEFLAVVARRVNLYEAGETGSVPGMGLAIYSIGGVDAELWEDFVSNLYEMDEEARRDIETKQLKKLHLIVSSGENLANLIEQAKADHAIDFQTNQTLKDGDKHLLTISHSSDHKVRARLRVEVEETKVEGSDENQGVGDYRLKILDEEHDRDAELDKLMVGA